jgi:hypothetical protein
MYTYPACKYCLSWSANKCQAFTRHGWGVCIYTAEQRARMESEGRKVGK